MTKVWYAWSSLAITPVVQRLPATPLCTEITSSCIAQRNNVPLSLIAHPRGYIYVPKDFQTSGWVKPHLGNMI